MTVYKCTICDTLFDEDKENRKWDQLEADWACFVCESGKSLWQPMASGKIEAPAPEAAAAAEAAAIPDKTFDEFETTMADIRAMAEGGTSIVEPFRSLLQCFSWDDIMI